MRILVLGGGGKEGGAIAKRLAAESDISQVVVGDRSKNRAEESVAKIGKKGSVAIIDINDTTALVNLIRKVDLVTNCVGPFYRFKTKVLKAAIEAKKNYVDIVDDADVVLEMLELDKAAKEAGILALISMGSTPGLSNVICKYGADKLDRVDKIHIYWVIHIAASGGGTGAALHSWHMFSQNLQFLDAKLTMVPCGSGVEIVDFSDGQGEVYYCGHSEQITLPRYIKGVKEVTNKGGILPDWVTRDQLKLMDMGFNTDEPIKIRADTFIIPIEVGLAMHYRYVQQRKDFGLPWQGEKWEVIGEKNGKATTYSYQFRKGSKFMASDASMDVVSSLPATPGVCMVARGEVGNVKGVVAPEGCLDPKLFLSRFMKEGGEALTETVTVSGDLEI